MKIVTDKRGSDFLSAAVMFELELEVRELDPIVSREWDKSELCTLFDLFTAVELNMPDDPVDDFVSPFARIEFGFNNWEEEAM